MAIHTADAIILRRYPFRETSITLSCLTDRFGKLSGLVKGIRTQPNRYRSAMEPFTINRIVFYDTRTSQLHLITQCDLLDPLSALQRDVETMRLAAFCVELTDTVVPASEPQPLTYALLRDTLERLALGAGEPEDVRLHFIVRLLRLAGFQPQLDACTGCGSAIHTGGYWSAKQGGLLCERCLHEDPAVEPASDHVLEALEQMADTSIPIPLEPQLRLTLRQQLDAFLRWRLDRPLKTMAV